MDDYPSLARAAQAKAARIPAVPEKLLYLIQEIDRLIGIGPTYRTPGK
jgi:hypothetical protein